jgi:lipoprotein signal peptidase
MTMHRNVKLALYLGVAVCVVDQLSKWWVVRAVPFAPEHMYMAPFLNFSMVHNSGVTFGLLNNLSNYYKPYALAAVAAVFLFVLGRWLWRTTSRPVALALGAIIGGAIGNIIDRLRFGYVVDFIDVYYQNYHWYAFNIADAAVVTGVVLLMLDSLVRAK